MGGSITTKFFICVSCKQGTLFQSHQTAFKVRTLIVILSYPIILRYHFSFPWCPSNALCSKRIQSRVTTVVSDPVSCLRSCHGCSQKFPALRTLRKCDWGKTLLSLFCASDPSGQSIQLHAESCKGSKQEASKFARGEFLRFANFDHYQQLSFLFT